MRNPPAAEIFNEEAANLIKRKIKESLVRIGSLGIDFDYDGHVTVVDAQEVLDKFERSARSNSACKLAAERLPRTPC